MTRSTKPAHEFKRRILLVVIGKTPQIVTETLFKLVVQSEPAFVPTEIHLITTSEGANSAKLALLGVGNNEGHIRQFLDDYNVPSIDFTESSIHVIADTEGRFLSDSESAVHNRIASDFITNKVKEFTSDNNCAVHVSLAGGRKTMSFYAGYALSLYGRAQDRLSHVLVPPEFQNNEDFFYPRPHAKRIAVDNTYYNTDDALIILSDIPYVRMRQCLPQLVLDQMAGFRDTIDVMDRLAAPAEIRIDPIHMTAHLNGLAVTFTKADFAFYYWMCRRRLDDLPPMVTTEDAFMQDYLEIYGQFEKPNSGTFERVEAVANDGDIPRQNNWIYQRKSKTNKRILDRLGEIHAPRFQVSTQEVNSKTGYAIDVPKRAITIDIVPI